MNIKKEVPNTKVSVVDAICSGGKTFALTHLLEEQQLEFFNESQFISRKNIVSFPSIRLAVQFFEDIQKLNVKNVHLITSKTCKNVAAKLTNKIQDINTTRYGIIVCTQSALKNLSQGFIQQQTEWVTYMDEIPEVHSFYNICAPYYVDRLITKHLKVTEIIDEEAYKLELIDEKEAKHFISLPKDNVNYMVRPIIMDLLNKSSVITDKEQWDRLVIRNEISTSKKADLTHGDNRNTISVLSTHNARICAGWKEAVIMGAHFKTSLLCAQWTERENIEFIEHKQLTSKLRYTEHTQGEHMSFLYLTEANWSKNLRDKTYKDGQTYNEYCRDIVSKYWSGEKFLSVSNNDMNDEDLPAGGTRIPVKCHGLNEYQGYHKIYFGAALNKSPMQMKLMRINGIAEEQVKLAESTETAYQCIMRTSARTHGSTEQIEVIVQDMATAYSLSSMFPGSKVCPIDGAITKKPKFDQKENNDKHQNNKTLNEITALNDQYKDIVYITEFKNKFSSFCNSKDIKELSLTNENTITYLNKFYDRPAIDNKDNDKLFNFTKFDGTARKKSNVIFATKVILDIDDGSMSIEEFEDIFKDISHISCNTFSRSITQPNRYRAIFNLDRKVNAAVYSQIVKYLVDIIEQNGFSSVADKNDKSRIKKENLVYSGIDRSKQNASDIFYAPCKNINALDYAFFHVNDGEAINVEEVIMNSKNKKQLPALVSSSVKSNGLAKDQNLFNKLKTRIATEFVPGNNFAAAKSIGAVTKFIEDENLKLEIASLVESSLFGANEPVKDYNAFKAMAGLLQ